MGFLLMHVNSLAQTLEQSIHAGFKFCTIPHILESCFTALSQISEVRHKRRILRRLLVGNRGGQPKDARRFSEHQIPTATDAMLSHAVGSLQRINGRVKRLRE
jgi:hypothetical protein